MADEDHSEARVTVWMSEAVRERMDDEYIDWRYESRSQWVREAVETRMALEDALAAHGVDLPEEPDTREAVIEAIVAAGVQVTGGDLDELDAADGNADAK